MPPPEISTLSLHELFRSLLMRPFDPFPYILLNLVLSCLAAMQAPVIMMRDRKSTRLNSSHSQISYAAPRDLHSFPTRALPISSDAPLRSVPLHSPEPGAVLPGCHAGSSHHDERSEEHTSELQSQSNLVCRPPRSPLFPYTSSSDLF